MALSAAFDSVTITVRCPHYCGHQRVLLSYGTKLALFEAHARSGQAAQEHISVTRGGFC
jgi:hypothetical protein